MLPAGLVSVPTILSYRFLAVSVVLKLLDLSLCIYNVVACLNARNMLEYDYDSRLRKMVAVDITTYVQIIACLLVAVSTVSLFFAVINCILAARYLRCLNNHVNFNEKGHPVGFQEEMPESLAKEQVAVYMP